MFPCLSKPSRIATPGPILLRECWRAGRDSTLLETGHDPLLAPHEPSTVPDQVAKLKQRFGLDRAILVGNRGILTQTQIQMLKQYPGMGRISAMLLRNFGLAGGKISHVRLNLCYDYPLGGVRSSRLICS
jgi:hypothetical protein